MDFTAPVAPLFAPWCHAVTSFARFVHNGMLYVLTSAFADAYTAVFRMGAGGTRLL